MTGDNQNFIIAIALSVAIVLGWNIFYAKPQLEQQRATQEMQQEAQQAADDPSLPKVESGAQPSDQTPDLSGAVKPRAAAIAETPRIAIDSPSLTGSINLTGGRIDDLRLKKYRVEVDANSPIITLLSPAGTKGGYFAEQGWLTGAASTTKVPAPDTVWSAPDGAVLGPDNPISLTWNNGQGVTFKRTISVDDQYMFTIVQEVVNKSAEPISLFPYARIQRQGIPKTRGIYVLHEGLIGVLGGELKEINYKDLEEATAGEQAESTGGWLGITDKYWAVALVPDQGTVFNGRFTRPSGNGRDIFQTDYLAKNGLVAQPGGKISFTSELFAGAKVVNTVNTYAETYKIERFDRIIDWGWFYFLTVPLFWLMDHIFGFVGNFGFTILIVTVMIKAVFYPLANKSYSSMAKMKKLQPEMVKIRERFADDKMKQQEQMMQLYKKEQVSPLSGCLPVVVQIPVFFALYKVIYVTIEMRHAPFIAWIRDLSAPDPTSVFNLFGLIPWAPPSFLLIGVLPLIMGVTMWVQMRLNPAPPDPIQAQIFMWMPVFFTVLLANFPAGLVLYWAWNNFLSILQQYSIMRRQGVDVNLLENIREALPFLKSKTKDAEGKSN